MKAFKTFIASAIAGALILSMATSAFAMTVNSVNTDSVVSVSGASNVEGERTVLVVSKNSWNGSVLLDGATIVYINQVDYAELGDTLAAMAGKDLVHGDYTVLVGNEEGTVDAQTFTALKVERLADGESADGETPVSWNVTMSSALLAEALAEEAVVARFYDAEDGYIDGTEKAIWAEDGLDISGSGEFTFTAETTVSDEFVADTQLQISAGTVSHKN